MKRIAEKIGIIRKLTLLLAMVLPIQSLTAGSFKFVQLADPQLGRGGYEADVARLEQAVEQINTQQPDFVLICGDLVEQKGHEAGYVELLNVLERLSCPVHLVPGNHDVGTSPDGKALAQYRKVVGPDYFNFEHEGWTFIGVNTQLWLAGALPEETEIQQQWLINALQRVQGGRIIMFGHYPLYRNAPDEALNYSNIPPGPRAALLILMEQHDVKAYLSGHAHDRIMNDYRGIQLVTALSTTLNQRGQPCGYRMWTVGANGDLSHEFVALEDGKGSDGPDTLVVEEPTSAPQTRPSGAK